MKFRTHGSATVYQLRTLGGTCLDIIELSHRRKTRLRNAESGETGWVKDSTLRALLESQALSLHMKYRGSWHQLAGRRES